MNYILWLIFYFVQKFFSQLPLNHPRGQGLMLLFRYENDVKLTSSGNRENCDRSQQNQVSYWNRSVPIAKQWLEVECAGNMVSTSPHNIMIVRKKALRRPCSSSHFTDLSFPWFPLVSLFFFQYLLNLMQFVKSIGPQFAKCHRV